jgi:AcrR family transcriptional regulator
VGDESDGETTRRSPGARPTDDHLLDAARSVFAERGHARATMGAIAERADSTKPTLYAHFGDKDALYQATLAREGARLRDWVTTAYSSAAGLPVEQQVHVYVMALFTFAATHPEGFAMLFDMHAPDALTPVRQDLVETIKRAVADQIRLYLTEHDRTPGPSADLLAAMLVGMVGAAAGHALRSGLDPLAAGELATRFIISALRDLGPEALDNVDGKHSSQRLPS